MKSAFSYIKHLSRTQIIWAAIAAAVLLAGWYFFVRSAPAAEQTLLLEQKLFLQQVSVSGKVVAAKEVDLGFSQSGRVIGVYAVVGQRVAQGTTLCETPR